MDRRMEYGQTLCLSVVRTPSVCRSYYRASIASRGYTATTKQRNACMKMNSLHSFAGSFRSASSQTTARRTADADKNLICEHVKLGSR